MENLGICELKKQLQQSNSNTYVYIDISVLPAVIVVRCTDCNQLNLPKGYYLEKNQLTNKGNTTSGFSESYNLMTEYDYLCMKA